MHYRYYAYNQSFYITMLYSLTCIKRSWHLGHRKSGLLRKVTSFKRFNSNEIFYNRTGKRWRFNTDDCLLEVTAWACLSVFISFATKTIKLVYVDSLLITQQQEQKLVGLELLFLSCVVKLSVCYLQFWFLMSLIQYCLDCNK